MICLKKLDPIIPDVKMSIVDVMEELNQQCQALYEQMDTIIPSATVNAVEIVDACDRANVSYDVFFACYNVVSLGNGEYIVSPSSRHMTRLLQYRTFDNAKVQEYVRQLELEYDAF